MVTQTIRVNLNQKDLETILAVQSDTLREIAFEFYATDADEAVQLDPDDFTVKFNVLKPDNNFVMTTFTDGVIKLSDQITAVTGTGYYCILLMQDDELIYSGNGKIIINDHVIGTENIDSVSEADGYTFPDDFYTKDTPLAVLDDSTTSTTSTWSSNKINGEINTASTSAFAQLNAMKTGFDGVVYSSPAAMVQGEDQKLYDQIADIQKSVLFQIHLDTLGQVKPFFVKAGDVVTLKAADGSTMTVGQIRFYRAGGTFDYWSLSGNKVRTITMTEDFVSAFLWDGTAQDIIMTKTGSYLDFNPQIDTIEGEIADINTDYSNMNQDIGDLNDAVFNIQETPITTSRLSDAYIGANGTIASGGSALSVLFFAVTQNEEIHITADDYYLFGDYGAIAFYNSTPTVGLTGTLLLLGSATATDIDYRYVVPSDGYIGIARGRQTSAPVAKKIEKIPKSGNTIPIKIQVFGDSISDESWGDHHTWVSDIPSHMPNYELTVVNSAVGGSFLKSNNNVGVEDLVTNGTTLQTDSDVVVIFAGTNDWGSGSTYIGSITNQTAGFYKAVRNIIEYINEHSTATIIICTPIQRYNDTDAERPTNENGEPLSGTGADQHTLEEVCEAIENMAHFLGTDVLDLYHTSGFNRVNIMDFTTDGLHPNNAGDSKLAMMICSEIRRVFN